MAGRQVRLLQVQILRIQECVLGAGSVRAKPAVLGAPTGKARYGGEIRGGGLACGRRRRCLWQFTPPQFVTQPLVLLLRALQRALLLARLGILLNVIAVGETYL